MKYIRHLIALALGLAVGLAASAQEDSVAISGTLTNSAVGAPAPFCKVEFLRDSVLQSATLTDTNGYFDVGLIPAGQYTLRVSVAGLSLMQAHVDLQESTLINISVRPDTISKVFLQAVEIFAARQSSMLGPFLIRSHNHPWLYNLSEHSLSMPASRSLNDYIRFLTKISLQALPDIRFVGLNMGEPPTYTSPKK